MSTLDERFQVAIDHFWDARRRQQQKQIDGGRLDAGSRGAVTGGTQMGALELLVVDLLAAAGLNRLDVRTRTALELPGYYRPEKKWDLLVVSEQRLVAAIEFKSQVGPSFSNNYNNRVEEAIGNATDFWMAFREQRLGLHRPLLGYFFLLADDPKVHAPVRAKEPYFPIDPIYRNASYAERYAVLCQRLIYERMYDTVCLTLATDTQPSLVRHPQSELDFRQFVAKLQAHVRAITDSTSA